MANSHGFIGCIRYTNEAIAPYASWPKTQANPSEKEDIITRVLALLLLESHSPVLLISPAGPRCVNSASHSETPSARINGDQYNHSPTSINLSESVIYANSCQSFCKTHMIAQIERTITKLPFVLDVSQYFPSTESAANPSV